MAHVTGGASQQHSVALGRDQKCRKFWTSSENQSNRWMRWTSAVVWHMDMWNGSGKVGLLFSFKGREMNSSTRRVPYASLSKSQSGMREEQSSNSTLPAGGSRLKGTLLRGGSADHLKPAVAINVKEEKFLPGLIPTEWPWPSSISRQQDCPGAEQEHSPAQWPMWKRSQWCVTEESVQGPAGHRSGSNSGLSLP